MTDSRLKYLENFLFFVKRMKVAKSSNPTKSRVNKLKKYSTSFAASLYVAFVKNEGQLEMIIDEHYGLRNLACNYEFHASEYLNIPIDIIKIFWQCFSYNDLIYFIEKTIKELPDRKYLVRTINHQSEEVTGIQLLPYFDIPKYALPPIAHRNSKMVADAYPLSKLLEGILD
jgi:hypothetical protein